MRSLATFLLLLPLCLGIATPSRSQDQWAEHAPEGAGYRIEFPGAPKHNQADRSTPEGTMRVTAARLEAGGNVYVATSATFPVTAYDDAQHALGEARRKAVKNMKGKLRTEQRMTVSGAPARRIVVDVASKKQVQVGLIVLRANQLFQALVTVPAGREASADVDRFLNSLALTGGAGASQ
ncbi:MAG: hypothetical protein NTV97_09745 [Alphaproteobacteria bacterium]|nr:hypothetical protein [Alphaproteobacteria bacterium]